MLGEGASSETRGPQRPQREAGTSSSQTGLLSELINPQITNFPKGYGFSLTTRGPQREGGRDLIFAFLISITFQTFLFAQLCNSKRFTLDVPNQSPLIQRES